MSWQEIIGQTAAISYLQKSMHSARMPQALLFCGPSGVGKKKTALELAKALNCLDESARAKGDSCGVCAHCRAWAQGTYPDITVADFLYQARLELKTEPTDPAYEEDLEKELAKQQHIKVDTIRDITAKSQQKSATGGWKILIVDEAQSMQAEAANALLKFIEEPPAKTVWILLTDKKEALLKTILSRCQPVTFAPLAEPVVADLLKQVRPDTENPALAARYAAGSVTRAVRVAQALELMQSVTRDAAWPAGVAAELPRSAVQARQVAQTILDIWILVLHQHWKEAGAEAAAHWQQLLQKMQQYKTAILRNVSPAIVLETALMYIAEEPISMD